MSSAAHRAFRAGAPLVVAAAGWALWVRAPGSLVGALPLLFCPGWGLLRILSVVDRRFGVAGASLCLSALVLALVALLSAGHHLQPEQLGLIVHLVTLLLTAAGGLRLAHFDRWQARQPAHPAPMPLLPRGWPACLAVMALAVAGVLLASPLGRPPQDSQFVVQASRALGFQHGGEDPFLAGAPQSPAHLLAAAAASLSAGCGLTPLVAAQLLAIAALLATLMLSAESISRLLGNRGALLCMLAVLLGLHPLAGVFVLAAPQHHGALTGPPPGYAPPITTALAPFTDGSDLALPLAFAAMLLSCSLSVLRRSSFHVPRLAGCAAFGLALARPSAALLLLPGWIAGIASAHLLCRERERRGEIVPDLPRRGEPPLLRAPFWALAIPVAAGGFGGLMLAGLPALLSTPTVTAWRILLAVGPAALLFIPGVRHLNASPGREGWFFLGMLLVSLPLLTGLGPPGDHGEEAVRLLAVLLAVPVAHGALKLHEWSGPVARRLAPVAGLLLLLPGPIAFLTARAQAPRCLDERTTDPSARCAALPADFRRALDTVRASSPRDAVLALPAQDVPPGASPPLLVLLSERTLLAPVDASACDDAELLPSQLAECARRTRLLANLPTGVAAPLFQLRGLGGLRAREFWAVHSGAPWPGFRTVGRAGDLLIERAAPPTIVLVTVASLRSAALAPATMPQVSLLAARGVRCEQVVSPLPDTLPGLASLLTGLSPREHGVSGPGQRAAGGALTLAGALAPAGYRTAAVVALDEDGGLLAGFEETVMRRNAGAESLVDSALEVLSAADPRPVFLWLHLADPDDALLAADAGDGDGEADRLATRYAAALGTVDHALARLAASVPEQDALLLTAPHGTNLDEHAAPFTHGRDLFEPSVHVPLLIAGAGLPAGDFPGLLALQDVQAMLLTGELPERERVFLQTAAAPGTPLLWGLRTAEHKVIVAAPAASDGTGSSDGTGPVVAQAYDLATDPGETQPLPADEHSVRTIESFRRMVLR